MVEQSRDLCDDEVSIILSYLPRRRFILRKYYVDFVKKSPKEVLRDLIMKGGDTILLKIVYECEVFLWIFGKNRTPPCSSLVTYSSWYGNDKDLFIKLYQLSRPDVIDTYPSGLSTTLKYELLNRVNITPTAYVKLLHELSKDELHRDPNFIREALAIDDTIKRKCIGFGDVEEDISIVFDCPDQHHRKIGDYEELYEEEADAEDVIRGMMDTVTDDGVKLGTGVSLMALLKAVERLTEKVERLTERIDNL